MRVIGFIIFLLGASCYAQESTTPPTSVNKTSDVEQVSGPKVEKDSGSVRLLPLTNPEPVQWHSDIPQSQPGSSDHQGQTFGLRNSGIRPLSTDNQIPSNRLEDGNRPRQPQRVGRQISFAGGNEENQSGNTRPLDSYARDISGFGRQNENFRTYRANYPSISGLPDSSESRESDNTSPLGPGQGPTSHRPGVNYLVPVTDGEPQDAARQVEGSDLNEGQPRGNPESSVSYAGEERDPQTQGFRGPTMNYPGSAFGGRRPTFGYPGPAVVRGVPVPNIPRTPADPEGGRRDAVPQYPRPAVRSQVPAAGQRSPPQIFPTTDARRPLPAARQPGEGRDTRTLGSPFPDVSYRRLGTGARDPSTVSQPRPTAWIPEQHEHRPFSFNYISEADDGMYTHQQSADNTGRVIGSYAMSLEDGRKRIVEYIADENGFRASIDTNEPGTSFEDSPADVVYYSGGSSGVRPNLQNLLSFRSRGEDQQGWPVQGRTYQIRRPHTEGVRDNGAAVAAVGDQDKLPLRGHPAHTDMRSQTPGSGRAQEAAVRPSPVLQHVRANGRVNQRQPVQPLISTNDAPIAEDGNFHIQGAAPYYYYYNDGSNYWYHRY